MPIDRCFCREMLFTDLLEIARRNGLDAEGVCDLTGAGSGCGLCRSYLRVVLATGRTALPVLNDRQIEDLCRGAGTGAVAGGAPGSSERQP